MYIDSVLFMIEIQSHCIIIQSYLSLANMSKDTFDLKLNLSIEEIEQAFHQFFINEKDYHYLNEFPTNEISIDEVESIEQNSYIRSLRENSDLEILKKEHVQNEYVEKEYGIFNLFMNQSLFDCIRKWTNEKSVNVGRDRISKEMFNPHVGLELAMLLVQLNKIKDYWSEKKFLGFQYFKEVMSRNNFTKIGSNLKFYPKYEHDVAVKDTHWHSRVMLNRFLENSIKIAVPVGCSVLDENTVSCKAQTSAKSYMKSKPVKFGIRFYAVVSWKHPYIHSLWDNGSGNKTLFHLRLLIVEGFVT